MLQNPQQSGKKWPEFSQLLPKSGLGAQSDRP
jgi:hypothetical protein